jgi:hypothetical protein
VLATHLGPQHPAPPHSRRSSQLESAASVLAHNKMPTLRGAYAADLVGGRRVPADAASHGGDSPRGGLMSHPRSWSDRRYDGAEMINDQSYR